MKTHSGHNIYIKTTPRAMTVADLLKLIKVCKVPKDTKLLAANANRFQQIGQLSFCRDAGEITMW